MDGIFLRQIFCLILNMCGGNIVNIKAFRFKMAKVTPSNKESSKIRQTLEAASNNSSRRASVGTLLKDLSHSFTSNQSQPQSGKIYQSRLSKTMRLSMNWNGQPDDSTNSYECTVSIRATIAVIFAVTVLITCTVMWGVASGNCTAALDLAIEASEKTLNISWDTSESTVSEITNSLLNNLQKDLEGRVSSFMQQVQLSSLELAYQIENIMAASVLLSREPPHWVSQLNEIYYSDQNRGGWDGCSINDALIFGHIRDSRKIPPTSPVSIANQNCSVGYLPSRPILPSLQSILWDIVRSNDFLVFSYVCFEDGFYVDYYRAQDEFYFSTISALDPENDVSILTERVADSITGVPIIDENVYNLNYSCRDRPFYNISLNSASPVILPPYPFITTTPVIGLSISQQGGSLKSTTPEGLMKVVVGVDITLEKLSEFCRELTVEKGVFFIVERFDLEDSESGVLIGSSNGSVAVERDGDIYQISAMDSEHPLVFSASRFINQTFGSFAASSNIQLSFTFDQMMKIAFEKSVTEVSKEEKEYLESLVGKKIIVQISRLPTYGGVNWLTILAVPEEAFLGDIPETFEEGRKQVLESKDATEKEIEKTRDTFFMISIIGLVCCVSFAALIAFCITQPLVELDRDMKKITMLDFESIESKRSHIRELKAVHRTFQGMRNGMSTFKKFVPETVVKRIVSGDESAIRLHVQNRNVTIMFSDIRDFTHLSEVLDQSTLLIILTMYLTTMTKVIEEHKGTVGEILGDGILAFWNTPDDVQNHEIMACRAALKQQEALARLNRDFIDCGFPALAIRIGIHTGEVLSGNIGSPNRMKFGVVGDAVNLASRMEGLCKIYGVGIIMSKETYDGTMATEKQTSRKNKTHVLMDVSFSNDLPFKEIIRNNTVVEMREHKSQKSNKSIDSEQSNMHAQEKEENIRFPMDVQNDEVPLPSQPSEACISPSNSMPKREVDPSLSTNPPDQSNKLQPPLHQPLVSRKSLRWQNNVPFITRKLDVVRVKGRSQKTEVIELICETHEDLDTSQEALHQLIEYRRNFASCTQYYELALDLFLNGEISRCYIELVKFLQMCPKDKAAKYLKSRCYKILRHACMCASASQDLRRLEDQCSNSILSNDIHLEVLDLEDDSEKSTNTKPSNHNQLDGINEDDEDEDEEAREQGVNQLDGSYKSNEVPPLEQSETMNKRPAFSVVLFAIDGVKDLNRTQKEKEYSEVNLLPWLTVGSMFLMREVRVIDPMWSLINTMTEK